MTAVLPDFRLVRPASVAEALAARAAAKGLVRFMAGGTDMIPAIRRGLVAPETVIDVSGIAELRGIAVEDGGLRIGAAVTLAEIESDPLILRHIAGLAEAAKAV
ncbi:MAG: 4-hydroxybenzoyl-CoA reductase subunit beta, partial [Alphaproteobacteria bacterium]|nr:4-hydroxybenzoyl-CoA reductase subunit beta [Alphaproteobacteria bacterium]